MRRGPIKIPTDAPAIARADGRERPGKAPGAATPGPAREPELVNLPAPHILQAGISTFNHLAKLHWPDVKEGFKLSGFDVKNDRMLRFTLGIVYMAMREADK